MRGAAIAARDQCPQPSRGPRNFLDDKKLQNFVHKLNLLFYFEISGSKTLDPCNSLYTESFASSKQFSRHDAVRCYIHLRRRLRGCRTVSTTEIKVVVEKKPDLSALLQAESV